MARIGLVVHGQPPEVVGGTERLVDELARGLQASGETVEVFSGSIVWKPAFEVVRDEGGPVPVTRVHRHDLFFERWDKLHNPLVERAYVEWLAAFRPDVVHVHHWARLTTTLVSVARARGIPVALSLHDLFASCPRYHRVKDDLSFCEVRPEPDACRTCAPRWRFQGDAEMDASVTTFVAEMAAEVAGADAVLVPTAGHGRRVMQALGPGREVDVVPPGGSGLAAPASRPLGALVAGPSRPLAVGVFGHLHPLKGVEVLLDAQAALPDPSLVHLHVWGAAPDEPTGRALRERAGDRPVTWHGAYAPADLAAAPVDAVCLPTLCAESYSFALDEAADLAVPILATDLGALADRATPRLARFPRGDAAALARLLVRLAQDPDWREQLARAAPPARVTPDEHLQATRAVYGRLLEGPRPTRQGDDELALAQREHLFGLREAGLAELLRSEGWEDVVAGLQAELEALRRAASP